MRFATLEIPTPKLLTVRQVQGLVRLSYRGTLRLIAKRLKPLGAVIERPGGRRYHVLVHDWGVAKLLQPGTHCPACGRATAEEKVGSIVEGQETHSGRTLEETNQRRVLS